MTAQYLGQLRCYCLNLRLNKEVSGLQWRAFFKNIKAPHPCEALTRYILMTHGGYPHDLTILDIHKTVVNGQSTIRQFDNWWFFK